MKLLAWALLAAAMIGPTVAACAYFLDAGIAGENRAAIYAASKIIQLFLPLVYLRLLGRKAEFGRPSQAGMRLGVAFGLVVGLAILGLYLGWLRDSSLFAEATAALQRKLESFHVATPGRFLMMAAFITILHSLFEEYCWRWFVFGELERMIPLWAALAVSSLTFMAHHVVVLMVYFPGHFWTAALPFSLGVAGGGLVWAWIYHRTRSIWSTWASHLLVDAALMVVGYLMVFGRAA